MERGELARAVLAFVDSIAPLYPVGLSRAEALPDAGVRLVFLTESLGEAERKLFDAVVSNGLRWSPSSCVLLEAGLKESSLAAARSRFPTARLVTLGVCESAGADILVLPSLAAVGASHEVKRDFWNKLSQYAQSV